MASLTGRLELLVEDAERADEEAEEEAAAAAGAGAAGSRLPPAVLSPVASGRAAVVGMPRRIAVPWVLGEQLNPTSPRALPPDAAKLPCLRSLLLQLVTSHSHTRTLPPWQGWR